MIAGPRQLWFHIAKTAGHTRSANESSSCPINEDFFLHLATFPSKRSKSRPNGMNAYASQRSVSTYWLPKQYRSEARTDMTRFVLEVLV